MTRTSSHSSRPPTAVRAGVLASLALLVLLAVGCGGGSGQRTPGPRTLTARTDVNPAGGVGGAGAVWVANAGAGTVWKLDARTGRRLALVPVGDA